MLDIILASLENEDDKNRITQIYNRYAAKLCTIAVHWLSNEEDAEDALQESFLELIKKPEIYRSKDERALAYLYAVLENKCKDILKRNKRSPIILDFSQEQLLVSDQDIEKNVTNSELENALLNAIHKLKSAQREVMYIYFMSGGIPLKEIAKKLNRPYTTVVSQYKSGLAILKTILKEYNDND